MKIEKHYDWKEPIVYIEHNSFDITITKNEIEIDFTGRNDRELIFIETSIILEVLKELNQESKDETN